MPESHAEGKGRGSRQSLEYQKQVEAKEQERVKLTNLVKAQVAELEGVRQPVLSRLDWLRNEQRFNDDEVQVLLGRPDLPRRMTTETNNTVQANSGPGSVVYQSSSSAEAFLDPLVHPVVLETSPESRGTSGFDAEMTSEETKGESAMY